MVEDRDNTRVAPLDDDVRRSARAIAEEMVELIADDATRDRAFQAECDSFAALDPPAYRARMQGSLFHGRLAAATAIAAYASIPRGDTRRYADIATRLVEQVFEDLRSSALGIGLQQGVTGLLHVVNVLAEFDPPYWLKYQEYLLATIVSSLENGGHSTGDGRTQYADFDTITGLSGVGLAAMNNRHLPMGARVVRLCSDKLANAASLKGASAFSVRTADVGDRELLQIAPDEHMNVGMAHGLTGVLACLEAGACVTGRSADIELASRHIWGALQDATISDTFGSGLPSLLLDDGSPVAGSSVRLGWCYGLAGLAPVAEARSREGLPVPPGLDIESVWDSIAGRWPFRIGVSGLSLCHGSAGIAHAAARSTWLGETDPRMQSTLVGDAVSDVAQSIHLDRPGLMIDSVGSSDVSSTGLLDGVPGVLCFLSAVLGGSSVWDAFMGPSVVRAQ